LCKRVKVARAAGSEQKAEHDEADHLFYEKLSAVCGNSVLAHMVRTIRDALNEKISTSDETISPKDPDKARQLVTKHFNSLLRDTAQLFR